MDLGLVQLGVSQSLLHGLHGASEQVSIQLLKPSPGNTCVEINALEQRVNLNAGLGARGQGPLCPFTGRPQTPDSSLVFGNVFLVFALEFLNKVVHHSIVKVLTTQVSVSRCGFHLKDSVLNGQNRDIKGSSSQVKDQNVALTLLHTNRNNVDYQENAFTYNGQQNSRKNTSSKLTDWLPTFLSRP